MPKPTTPPRARTSHLLLFPVGTAADIDYIMQYTVSNPRNVHSLSLTTTADPKAVQSSNVEHSLQYAWVQTLLAEIATTSTRPLHAKLQDSPLWQKLLLCHKPLYALLQSVKIAAPANDDPQTAVTTPDDLRTMHKRIIGGLMLNDIVYYVASVDQHVQIQYSDYLESGRDSHTDVEEYTEPVEDIHDGDQVRAATQLEHDAHKRTWPLQFTRMTWPLRDLNVFTRISLPKRIHSPHGEHIVHPYHHTFASSSGMHSQEQSMFNFMRHLQERSDSARQCRDAAFDNDTAHTCEPAVTVPADILRQYQHMRHAPANMHKLFGGAVPSVSADPMSAKEPLVAWRWKMLMIQMNLLSALNGICNELKDQKYVPHHISTCDRACSEKTLLWQNFELKQHADNAVYCTRTVFPRKMANVLKMFATNPIR